MANLFDPPPIFGLPFSKGGDLYFGFIYKPLVVDEAGLPILDSGGKKQYEITDYPADSTLELFIETDAEPIIVEADIAGSLATFWEDKEVADTVVKGKLWRAVITYGNGLDQVMCNGTTVRSDGVVANR
jgi:hypothetical protein